MLDFLNLPHDTLAAASDLQTRVRGLPPVRRVAAEKAIGAEMEAAIRRVAARLELVDPKARQTHLDESYREMFGSETPAERVDLAEQPADADPTYAAMFPDGASRDGGR